MLLINALINVMAAELNSAPTGTLGRPNRAFAPAPDEIESAVKSRAWKHIVLHHSATSQGSVASIDAVHRQQKDGRGVPWLGIGYHFVIGNGRGMSDGEVQATFRWREQLAGAHAGVRNYNDAGIGICLIGNFDEQPPTTKQLDSLRPLLKRLTRKYAIGREQVLKHRDVQATLCPGRMFPWDALMADLTVSRDGM